MTIHSPLIKPKDPSFWNNRSITDVDSTIAEHKSTIIKQKRKDLNKSMSYSRQRDFSMSLEDCLYTKNVQPEPNSPLIPLSRIYK
jgi:hypothetical protein